MHAPVVCERLVLDALQELPGRDVVEVEAALVRGGDAVQPVRLHDVERRHAKRIQLRKAEARAEAGGLIDEVQDGAAN